jgi:WhiB family redox-sensing transcriptional regulator
MTVWERPGWHRDAACKEMPTSLFYPENGDHLTAVIVCQACPVREECAEAGDGERFGIWGGMSVRQRVLRRRPHPKPVAS